ncbi:transcriptional regulator with XRE-family HTH domain [Lachnospiraceae bacterium PM6-15]|uniref:helix-turn-helix domain-containing protein n=1 Tax=Ohessyouella blattaphilus TaxID=2949333 RepID=UPI003E22F830
MDLGSKISNLRKKLKMNQREFAKAIGVSNGAVAMWETNKRQPDLETLLKLANFFNVSTDYLLGKEQTPTNIITELDSPSEKAFSQEEQDVINYFRQLDKEDRQWIVGQMLDLIRKNKASLEEDSQVGGKFA